MEPISPPESFLEAMHGVRRNLSAAAVFIGFALAGSLALMLVHYFTPEGDASPPLYWRLLATLSDLVQAAMASLGACIGLGRMGRDLDRPLWKIRTDGESIRRFFLPWFILIAGDSAVNRLLALNIDAEAHPESILLYMLFCCALSAWIIPIGACIMFHGRLKWTQVGEALAPLTRSFSLTAFFLLFGFISSLMLTFVALSLPLPYRLIIETADNFCGCIIFAGIWELCRFNRNHPPEHDFDF